MNNINMKILAIFICVEIIVALESRMQTEPLSSSAFGISNNDGQGMEHDNDEEILMDNFDIEYRSPPRSDTTVYFFETFDDPIQAASRWIPSQAEKAVDTLRRRQDPVTYDGQWDFELPKQPIFPNDRGLVLHGRAQHSAISASLDKRFEFSTKPLIVQYEVTFQNGLDCGGAYIKLLSQTSKHSLKLEDFNNKTPFTIMFGPDKCGSDIKLHFIFRHKNPLNGAFQEKHAKQPRNRGERAFNDKKPHLYRLVLSPDNQFEIFVDRRLVASGNLLKDMEPPVNPPMEIMDPSDFKPNDWDDSEMLSDGDLLNSAEWNENAPRYLRDPIAKAPPSWMEMKPEKNSKLASAKPKDWDENMDCKRESPLIPNPKRKVDVSCDIWEAPMTPSRISRLKWKPPVLDNIKYKGQWARRMIPNPNYFDDKEPFKMTPIGAVGLEIWTMSDNILFDNFIISDNIKDVDKFTEKTYSLKMLALEGGPLGIIDSIISYSKTYPSLYAVLTVFLVIFVTVKAHGLHLS